SGSGVALDASGEPRPPNTPAVEIIVQDQGSGIPTEQVDRVFDRFHRVDTRLTREADGLGLGLAICKRIVELHGGQIWAESTTGAGSAFHVLLPLVPSAGAVQHDTMRHDTMRHDTMRHNIMRHNIMA